jgi:hypothetical protein
MKVSPSLFRCYCQEMWYAHKDETLRWTGKPLTCYDKKYYFAKSRWYLKKKYKDLNG